jgi:hypothetical protein
VLSSASKREDEAARANWVESNSCHVPFEIIVATLRRGQQKSYHIYTEYGTKGPAAGPNAGLDSLARNIQYNTFRLKKKCSRFGKRSCRRGSPPELNSCPKEAPAPVLDRRRSPLPSKSAVSIAKCGELADCASPGVRCMYPLHRLSRGVS